MNLLLSIIGLALLLGTVLALIIRQHTYNKRVADAEEYGRPTPTKPKTKHRDIALMVAGVALITLSKCFTKWNGELPKYMGNDGNMFGIFESAVTSSGN